MSVHWASLLSFAPPIIGIVAAQELSHQPTWAACAVVAGAGIMFALHARMPLVPRDA